MNCFLVDKNPEGQITTAIVPVSESQLPEGEVLVDIEYSSLNYKDALAATGQPGVALSLPLVPGIDAVGKVIESSSPQFAKDQPVIIGFEDFGTRVWGGWSSLARVPAEGCINLPPGLSALQAMTLGTAGFTAAQSIDKILIHGVSPEDGPIVVSGATGGVGVMAIKLLNKLGFRVVAATGKRDREDWLKHHGASEVIDRSTLDDHSGKPLLSSKWAAAVDTVGGNILATLIRSTRRGGMVTACGMVAGNDFQVSVFPFILRGVVLHGIDSAGVSQEYGQQIWNRLADQWLIEDLGELSEIVPLSEVSKSVEAMLKSQTTGRTVVKV